MPENKSVTDEQVEASRKYVQDLRDYLKEVNNSVSDDTKNRENEITKTKLDNEAQNLEHQIQAALAAAGQEPVAFDKTEPANAPVAGNPPVGNPAPENNLAPQDPQNQQDVQNAANPDLKKK